MTNLFLQEPEPSLRHLSVLAPKEKGKIPLMRKKDVGFQNFMNLTKSNL